MVLRVTEILLSHPMGVVKAGQPFAVRTVQCSRVVESMRFLQRHSYARYYKSDPVATLRIDHEHLAVKVKQCIHA